MNTSGPQERGHYFVGDYYYIPGTSTPKFMMKLPQTGYNRRIVLTGWRIAMSMNGLDDSDGPSRVSLKRGYHNNTGTFRLFSHSQNYLDINYGDNELRSDTLTVSNVELLEEYYLTPGSILDRTYPPGREPISNYGPQEVIYIEVAATGNNAHYLYYSFFFKEVK